MPVERSGCKSRDNAQFKIHLSYFGSTMPYSSKIWSCKIVTISTLRNSGLAISET